MPEILGRLRPPRLNGAPATPANGEMYYDTVGNKLYWWDGTQWIPAMDAGGSALTGEWTWTTSTGTGSVASGQVGIDTGAWNASTIVRINKTTNLGADAANFVAKFNVGDTLYIQQKDDAARWGRYTVRAAVTDNGTWMTVPVTWVKDGTTMPSNNARMLVMLVVGGGAGGASGTAGGDLSGTYPNPTVTKVRSGVIVDSTGMGGGDATPAIRSGSYGGPGGEIPGTKSSLWLETGGSNPGPWVNVDGSYGWRPIIPGGGAVGSVLRRFGTGPFETEWASVSSAPEVNISTDGPSPRNQEVIWVDTDESPPAVLQNVSMDKWHLVGQSGEPAFQNSWANYGGATGVARFRKYPDGKVAIAGAIKTGTPPSVAFTLPAGYRPASAIFLPIITSGGTGYLNVATDGTCTVNQLTGAATTQTLLDNVEFDTESVTATATVGAQPMDTMHYVGAPGEPAFQNGWQNYGGAFTPVGFRKDPTGRVLIKGMMNKAGGNFIANEVLFTLPPGYRPVEQMMMSARCNGGSAQPDTVNQMYIYPDGRVMLVTGAAANPVNWLNISGWIFDTELNTAYIAGAVPALTGCRVRNSALITGVGGSWITINTAWDTEEFDTNAMHSPSTNPSNIYVVQAGYYQPKYQMSWDINTTGARGGRIVYHTGSSDILVGESELPGSASGAYQQTIVDGGTVFCQVGDYFYVQSYQTSGAAVNMNIRSSSSPGCWFEVVRAGV